MAVLAVLSTPNVDDAPDSTPRRLVSELPDVEIEVVQFESERSAAVVFLRMWSVPPAEFESVLADDPQIERVERLERTDEGALYRAAWAVDDPVIRCVAAANGMVIQADGDAEQWRLKVWFEEQSDAATFQQCCRRREVPLEVDRLTSLADLLSEGPATLSAPQREVLVLAYERGYFDEPRAVSQADLAAELDVSASAAGRRLRRGIRSLVEETLIE